GLIVKYTTPLIPDAVISKRDIVDGSFRPSASGSIDSPTSIVINYLPNSGTAASWVQASARQALVGVDDGDVQETESAIKLPGIRRAQEALRKAANRLARLQFPGIYEWQAFDAGVKLQRGDVVQLPNAWGLARQWVRILDIPMTSYGIY